MIIKIALTIIAGLVLHAFYLMISFFIGEFRYLKKTQKLIAMQERVFQMKLLIDRLKHRRRTRSAPMPSEHYFHKLQFELRQDEANLKREYER